MTEVSSAVRQGQEYRLLFQQKLYVRNREEVWCAAAAGCRLLIPLRFHEFCYSSCVRAARRGTRWGAVAAAAHERNIRQHRDGAPMNNILVGRRSFYPPTTYALVVTAP